MWCGKGFGNYQLPHREALSTRTVANCSANIPLKKSTYTLEIQVLLGGT